MLNAIITGATGGIGSAIARRLADGGYRVVLLGNKSADSLDKLQKRTCSPLALRGNLGNPSTVDNLIKQAMDLLGNVDLFVNCAGISHVGLITEESNEGWAEILDANLSSTFYCSRAIDPYMIREQKGRILNISSVWGNVGASCEVAYSATKGGINAFTKALAKELAPSGIAVNALACGIIDTPMNQCFSPDEIQEICDEIPAGRMGNPEEVGEMAFLLAQAPIYLTGQIITLDGGWI